MANVTIANQVLDEVVEHARTHLTISPMPVEAYIPDPDGDDEHAQANPELVTEFANAARDGANRIEPPLFDWLHTEYADSDGNEYFGALTQAAEHGLLTNAAARAIVTAALLHQEIKMQMMIAATAIAMANRDAGTVSA